MPTVAEQLRDTRKAQKLSIQRVAELTNIKSEHLRALEEGNYTTFAAPIYVRGFVKAYASVLKLDVAPILIALNLELAQLEKFRERPDLIPHEPSLLNIAMYHLSKLSWRSALPALLAVLLLGLGLWSYRALWGRPRSDPLAKLGPGMYQRPFESGVEFLPLPTNAPRK